MNWENHCNKSRIGKCSSPPGDLILYQGSNLCIYYDTNSWNFTRIGKLDIMTLFQHDLEAYFRSGEAERKGLPSVAYFAEKVFLSPGYFGDLIKKETGLTAQRYIQNKVIDLSKQYVMDKQLTINQVAYKLGFQYPQHFTRLFKQQVGVTPTEYRN
jgi:AraC-like DNA-binding protein